MFQWETFSANGVPRPVFAYNICLAISTPAQFGCGFTGDGRVGTGTRKQ